MPAQDRPIRKEERTTMRKVVWSGVAMVILACGGAFMGAQHAARYPNSFVGRCAMRVYRLWDPLIAAPADSRQAKVLLPSGQTQTANVPAPIKSVPLPEVVETIIIHPTEEEPPLALPRLAPEVIAAIERMRSEEESEAPPQPFDGRGPLHRMPYADEDIEMLPMPKADGPGDSLHLCLPGSFFFVPTSCWQTVIGRMMDSFFRGEQ
jgi:hypothetical protein